MRVILLGTGTSTGVPVPTCECDVCRSDDPRDRRLRQSALVEWDGASVLIDTATDLRQQVLLHGVRRIDAVLYTHEHADHVLGLDDLRLYNWRQRGPVPVFGSRRTLEALSRTFWYVFEDGDDQHTRPRIDRRPVERPFELLGRRVVPVPVLHGSLPIYGYRIDRFAYLTDVSDIPPASLELLDGLDTLVLNALRERPHPTHFTVAEAIEMARRIGARRTLLTHVSHEVSFRELAPRLPQGIELAADGMSLEC